MGDKAIKRLATAGLMAAATILLTMLSVPLPGGHGYINLGDVGVIMTAFALGNPWCGLCAGIASGLADVLLGWPIYAPASFLVKGCLALAAAFMMKRKAPFWRVMGVYFAALIVPAGYFIYEWILYGAITAAGNVLFNLIQCIAGALLARVLIALLQRSGAARKFLPTPGRIVREPKGGPEVVLAGGKCDEEMLLKAGNILSVQGYVARIVTLENGVGVKDLNAAQREELVPESVPYVAAMELCAGASAEDVAKAALEAMKK